MGEGSVRVAEWLLQAAHASEDGTVDKTEFVQRKVRVTL